MSIARGRNVNEVSLYNNPALQLELLTDSRIVEFNMPTKTRSVPIDLVTSYIIVLVPPT